MRRRRFFQGNWVTVLLLALQIAIFIAETAAGGSESTMVLYRFGAKINGSVQAGEWWRLFTPIFIHIGWMHLLVNSATLYYIGGSVEQMIGHWRFLVIYLLSGISGNLMSFAFGASNTISAGASTALFGLFGVYIALGVVFRDNAYLRETGRQFVVLAVFNFVFDLVAQGIDLWGHLGGLIGGFMLLLVFPLPGQRRRQGTIVQICAIIGYFVICAFLYRIGMVR